MSHYWYIEEINNCIFFQHVDGSNLLKTKLGIISLSRRGVVVLLRALERMVWSSKFYKNTGIRHEKHPEFKVLRCSNEKSGSKASVQW